MALEGQHLTFGGRMNHLLVAFRSRSWHLVLQAAGLETEDYLEHRSPVNFFSEELDCNSPLMGLWIWEGEPSQNCGDIDSKTNEVFCHYSYGNGTWRQPTAYEWTQIKAEIPLWKSVLYPDWATLQEQANQEGI